MPEGLVISVDAMGGDRAPGIVIDGVEQAIRRHPGVRFLLHGPSERLAAMLASHPHARAVCDIAHTDTAIAMDAKPSQALRQGKGTSMWNAVAAVETGQAHAAVSAGNTGALMAISKLRLRMVEGVHRPAIVGSWPTPKGYSVMLDVGADVDADAEQLVEFAIMGEAFHRAVYGSQRPTVALLNIGSEELKGHEEIRHAARLVRSAGVDLAFIGFVEGDGISAGHADVVVTDGFTGNVAIKTGEGAARLVTGFLREALRASLLGRIGAMIAYPAFKAFKDRIDPSSVNGGVFLGLNGVVVKSHGGTDGAGFAAAINVAVRMARSHFREEIVANLRKLAGAAPPAPVAAETGQS
ncbi:MAG: phosphate acyltransferase PlsX [Hyphomonadaceae bacterium]